jgi:NADH-quinone oxidoreductase subunit H
MIFVLMLIRWTLPRFRYDQAMRLGWLGLFPLCILNIVFTGLVLLAWRD